jgi:hypothetical protein
MTIRSLKGEVLELSPEVRGLLDNGMDFLKRLRPNSQRLQHILLLVFGRL